MTARRVFLILSGGVLAAGTAAQGEPASPESKSAPAGVAPAPSTVSPQPAAPAPPTPRAAPAPGGGMANIGYLDATELASRCSRSDASSSSYCFAYLAAVTDTTRAYEIWLGSREFCLPAGTAQSDIRRAFITYVGAYPAQATGQAASVIINALKQTYPCD